MSFFFQAEDGIRVGRVTGVQTCALPISVAVVCAGGDGKERDCEEEVVLVHLRAEHCVRVSGPSCERREIAEREDGARARSEERRVGKEASACKSTFPFRPKMTW